MSDQDNGAAYLLQSREVAATPMPSTPGVLSLDPKKSPSFRVFLNRLLGRADSVALPFWGSLIIVAIVYVIFLLDTHRNLAPTSTAYYNYLLRAFSHGRADVTPPGTYDLSHYAGKWCLYWGPSPVLLILPFYAFSHLQAVIVQGIGKSAGADWPRRWAVTASVR